MRFLGGLVPLAALGGIIYLIVRAVRGRSSPAVGPSDGSSARRLFVYAMLFAALVVAALGLSGLLGRVMSTAAVRSDAEFATTLALTLVGVPVFAGIGRWVWRRLEADPAERDATGWALYMNGALVTSLAVTAGSTIALSQQWITGDGYDGEILATVIVWAVAWAGHWWTWRLLPPTRGSDLHLLAGSAIGLGILAAGAGSLIADAVRLAFDAGSDVVVGGPSGTDLFAGTAVAGIGAIVWSWHWIGHGLSLERTRPWLAYVLLYGVLGGLAAAGIGAGRAVFLVLEWLIGDPESTSAAVHFADLGPAVGAMVVGLAAWRYHGAIVGPRTGRARTDVDRIYDSIVAGVSLSAIAAAIAIFVVALFRLASPATAGTEESGGDVLLAAISLLLVGTPLWALTWRRMQHHAHTGVEEVQSAPRRSYLYAVLGVSGAVAFGALIRTLVVLFEAWLDERSGSLSEPLEWPIALLVTTGAIAAYHFVVARAERHLYVERRHRDVLLIWAGNGHAADIASITHADVKVLHRTDQPETEVDFHAVARAIERAEGEHLIVLAGEDGITVVPYD
jgi:hypothetical protein